MGEDDVATICGIIIAFLGGLLVCFGMLTSVFWLALLLWIVGGIAVAFGLFCAISALFM